MMKEVVRALETGILAEVGLIAFFVAFVLILVRVATLTPAACDDARRIPLDDADPLELPLNHK